LFLKHNDNTSRSRKRFSISRCRDLRRKREIQRSRRERGREGEMGTPGEIQGDLECEIRERYRRFMRDQRKIQEDSRKIR
jgi:hypothetical protein